MREAVRATSTGDAEEDAVIEMAIRASLKELKKKQDGEPETEALHRAIRASSKEAVQRSAGDEQRPSNTMDDEATYEAELEAAIKESLKIHPALDERLMRGNKGD